VAEDHALLAGRLEWNHRDPFDRMLAAQAMMESMVIITGDPVFAGCPGAPTLW
jgi:PIN domain nuclease of toxin-antitoxin system